MNMCLVANIGYILLALKRTGLHVSCIAKLHIPDHCSQGL